MKLLTLTVCCCLLPAPTARAQSRVFHDDFESSSLSKWSKDPSRALGSITSRAADGGTAQDGQRFLSLEWRGANFTSAWLTHWDYNREFLIRMWWRLDADVDQRPGAKLMRLGWDPHDGYARMVVQRDYPTNRPQENNLHHIWRASASERLLNCWDRNNILDDREWHRVEIYVKHDTNGRDGVIRFWFDGHLANCYPATGNTFSGRPWYPLVLASNWSQHAAWRHDTVNHFYVDKIEIFSDVGSGAVGRLEDATIHDPSEPPPSAPADNTPAMPTNLRIVGEP